MWHWYHRSRVISLIAELNFTLDDSVIKLLHEAGNWEGAHEMLFGLVLKWAVREEPKCTTASCSSAEIANMGD